MQTAETKLLMTSQKDAQRVLAEAREQAGKLLMDAHEAAVAVLLRQQDEAARLLLEQQDDARVNSIQLMAEAASLPAQEREELLARHRLDADGILDAQHRARSC